MSLDKNWTTCSSARLRGRKDQHIFVQPEGTGNHHLEQLAEELSRWHTFGMKAYSEDLRLRIVAAVERGMARAEIVTTFGVSAATIKRYLKQRRDTGGLHPKRRPGRPAVKGAALAAALTSQLQSSPDAILDEHCHQWATRTGSQVSTATMRRAIARLGWTRKKSRWVPPSATNTSGTPSATT